MHKTTTSRLILFLVVMIMIMPILNLNTNQVEAKEPKKEALLSIKLPAVTEEQILNSLLPNIIYELKSKTTSVWTEKKSDLTITYTEKPKKNEKKFTFEISAKDDAYYKTGFTIPFQCYNYSNIGYKIYLNMSYYVIVYDYSDIAEIPGLIFTYGINSYNYFWFSVETNYIVLKNTKLDLDPEYLIQIATGTDDRAMDACPAQRKIARFANGTMFATVFQNPFYERIYRSIDNGNTWVDWANRIGQTGAYDSCLVVDSKNTLHWAWARSVGLSTGLEYKNWTSASGWSLIYNITGTSVNPECVTMTLNKSDAIWFFYFNDNVSSGGHNSIWNRTFYKNVWGPQRVIDVGSATIFPSVTCDYNDVMHVTSMGEGAGNNQIWYFNVTKGVRSTPIEVVPNAGAYDQTYNCLINDDDNNLYLSWLGQYDGSGGEYYIRFKQYWFQNQTWRRAINLSIAENNATDYGMPSMTIDMNNTLYVVWGVSSTSSTTRGEWYMSFNSSGYWSSKSRFTTGRWSTTKSNVLYGNYPRTYVNYSWVSTMRPVVGFSVAYSNHTSAHAYNVEYYNSSTRYYGITGTNCPAQTHTPYSVTTTTATLKARVSGAGITNAQCGFIVGVNDPVTYYDRVFNVTSTNTPDTGEFFYYNISGLSKTTYYYVRCWIHPTGGAITWGNMTYMLTASEFASSFVIVSKSSTSATLRWLTPIITGTGNFKGVCRYSAGAAPSTPQSGTAGFNVTVRSGSVNSSAVTGLSPGNWYNFSLWIYVEKSGSPTIHAFSAYITSSVFTPGGQYNISFRYENSSYHPVDFSKCGGTENITRTAERTIRGGSGYTYTTSSGSITSTSSPEMLTVSSSFYNDVTVCRLEAFNTTIYDWVIIQDYGLCNGTFFSGNNTYKVKGGTVHGNLYWTAFKLTYKVSASVGVFSATTHINVTSANDDETLCQLEAYNTTYFAWYVIQSYGTCNGTFNVNNTYTVPAGTVHGGWRSYRLIYQSKVTATRCALILRYENRTEYNYFGYTNGATGYRSIQTNGDFNKTSKSYVLLNLSYTPLWFEFYWNTTKDTYRCYRMLVTEPNTKNYTFYVSTNKPVHNASSTTFINHLVDYTIQIIDGVGNLNIPPGNFSVWASIYTFDDNGNRMTIHSEYVDGQSQIYPELLFTKDYFIGIESPYYIFDAFARFKCTETTTQTTTVVTTNNSYETIALTLKCGWIDTTGGIWCYYFDGNNKITGSWLRIYDFNNNTLGNLLYGDSSNVYTNNFTYIAANHSRNYRIRLQFNITGASLTYNITMFKNETSMRRFSGSHINALMNMTFGFSPFRQINNPDIYVNWIDVIIFFISVFLVCSFPGQSAGLCGLVVGGIDIALGAMVSGVSVLLIPAGVIIFIFSLLYLLGGKK